MTDPPPAPSPPRRPTIEVDSPVAWTPDQALAVHDLLTELRQKIFDQYQWQILGLVPDQTANPPEPSINIDPEDLPF